MTISILGCGWFGLSFAKRLLSMGHIVKGSTTSIDKIGLLRTEGIIPFLINLPKDASNEIDEAFFDCELMVIAIPPKLRSNPASHYLEGITKIVALINGHNTKNVIFISSTSVFADENRNVSEEDPTHPDTDSGKVLVAAEHLLTAETRFKTTIVRFAGLIGPGRDPGRFFAGKTNIPNGRAPVNLIHLEDCCGVCEAILESNAFGFVFHACSPDHPSRQEFYTRASNHSNLPAPQFIDELTSWKIVNTTESDKRLSYKYKIRI